MGIFSSDDDEYTVEETTDWRGQKKIYRDSSGNVVGESREEQGPYGTKEVIRKPSLFGPGEEIAEIGEEQGFLGPKQVIREPRRWGLPGDELGEIGEEQGLLGPKQVMRGPSRWGLPGDKVAEATGERGLVRRLTVLKGRLPWVESREPIGGPEGGAPSPSAPSGSVGSSSRRAGATSASHPVAWTLLAAALLFTVVQVATRDGVTHAPAQPAATGAPGTTPGERFDDSTNSAGQPQSEVEAAVNCPSYTAPEDSRMVGAVSGALAAECGAHDWTFEAMSGEFLTVEASADPSIRALRVRLTAPDGMFLADTDCTVPPAIITDFELYTSGEHHLRVTSCDGEGQYHIGLFGLSTVAPADNGGSHCASYTAPEDSRMVGAVSGALAAECGAHDWTFEAMSGEFLTVEASADPSIRALRVRLTAPDGMFLADTDCTVPPAIITDFELYTSGEHHLRVTSCDGEGQYHLRLRR